MSRDFLPTTTAAPGRRTAGDLRASSTYSTGLRLYADYISGRRHGRTILGGEDDGQILTSLSPLAVQDPGVTHADDCRTCIGRRTTSAAGSNSISTQSQGSKTTETRSACQ